MPNPICWECNREYTIIEKNIYVVKMIQNGPHEVRTGDVYQCPECANKIVTGFTSKYTGQFEQKFQDTLDQAAKSKRSITLSFEDDQTKTKWYNIIMKVRRHNYSVQ